MSEGPLTSTDVFSAGTTSLIERSYQYPAAGQAQPQPLDTMTEKTPSGQKLYEYDYDVTGNTTRRVKAGEGQTLAWDAEGNLESVTDAAEKKTSYLYDVDGSRMLRKEPNQTTLYLPGMEVRLNHQSRAMGATRYIGLPGGSQVVRKNDGLRYVANDHHGTGNVTVDSAGVVAHRRTTPYGEARGVQPAAGVWPTEKGFVGGNQDPTTGLINIGAREYNTVTGRFISIDPIIDVNDPQQMNGYAYANNNPISFSDPDALKACPMTGVARARISRIWTVTITTSPGTTTVVVAVRGPTTRPCTTIRERLQAIRVLRPRLLWKGSGRRGSPGRSSRSWTRRSRWARSSPMSWVSPTR